uniref:Uncharacterized protein n=1 Tax=Lepeophtheirus salmonis TaxID=72036 RepID=A0A0K2T8Z4_LEPSM
MNDDQCYYVCVPVLHDGLDLYPTVKTIVFFILSYSLISSFFKL